MVPDVLLQLHLGLICQPDPHPWTSRPVHLKVCQPKARKLLSSGGRKGAFLRSRAPLLLALVFSPAMQGLLGAGQRACRGIDTPLFPPQCAAPDDSRVDHVLTTAKGKRTRRSALTFATLPGRLFLYPPPPAETQLLAREGAAA